MGYDRRLTISDAKGLARMAKLTATPWLSWSSSANAKQRTTCPNPIEGDASQRKSTESRLVTAEHTYTVGQWEGLSSWSSFNFSKSVLRTTALSSGPASSEAIGRRQLREASQSHQNGMDSGSGKTESKRSAGQRVPCLS